MYKKLSLWVLVIFSAVSFSAPAQAEGVKQGVSSFLVPTSGQYMNGEFQDNKTKMMAAMEITAITATAILASVVGGPVVWAGIGPLIANHAWSGYDAYETANQNSQGYDSANVQQAYDARINLDQTRQQRYDYVNNQNLSLKERMRIAGEQASRG